MFILITAIALAVFITGLILSGDNHVHLYPLGEILTVVGVIVLIAGLIGCLALGVSITNLDVIDERIAMYEAENAKIETDIAALVENYQQYETGVFDKVKHDSAMSMVSMYPELRSDSLVQAQIDIYASNKEKIRDLKDELISGSVVRWWFYFGH